MGRTYQDVVAEIVAWLRSPDAAGLGRIAISDMVERRWGAKALPPIAEVTLSSEAPERPVDHAYLSAGDNPYADGDRCYTGCSLCGRPRKDHPR